MIISKCTFIHPRFKRTEIEWGLFETEIDFDEWKRSKSYSANKIGMGESFDIFTREQVLEMKMDQLKGMHIKDFLKLLTL